MQFATKLHFKSNQLHWRDARTQTMHIYSAHAHMLNSENLIQFSHACLCVYFCIRHLIWMHIGANANDA